MEWGAVTHSTVNVRSMPFSREPGTSATNA